MEKSAGDDHGIVRNCDGWESLAFFFFCGVGMRGCFVFVSVVVIRMFLEGRQDGGN